MSGSLQIATRIAKRCPASTAVSRVVRDMSPCRQTSAISATASINRSIAIIARLSPVNRLGKVRRTNTARSWLSPVSRFTGMRCAVASNAAARLCSSGVVSIATCFARNLNSSVSASAASPRRCCPANLPSQRQTCSSKIADLICAAIRCDQFGEQSVTCPLEQNVVVDQCLHVAISIPSTAARYELASDGSCSGSSCGHRHAVDFVPDGPCLVIDEAHCAIGNCPIPCRVPEAKCERPGFDLEFA